MSKQDLEIRIANYYASIGEDLEEEFNLKPPVETLEELELKDKIEGHVRTVKNLKKEYIVNNGVWNELPDEYEDGDFLTKSDFDENLELSFADDEEVLAAIGRGKERANG